jgi:glycosyltransferase involved in cell wall biosynthesis
VITNYPTITVLLATLNGVRFLDEQLASLNAQIGVHVEVYVNDDGSTDGTIEVLERWKELGLIVSIIKSNRLGTTRAFFKLLQECEKKSFVAFCDQDDIWEPKKLATQIQLCEESTPTLVFSRRKYCNASGKIIGVSPKLKKSPSFANALIENIAPGNTILLNSSAIKLVNSNTFLNAVHYDSWIYLLISAFGKCKYIYEPLVQYRIHENNQVGLQKFNLKAFKSSALQFVHQASYLSANLKRSLQEDNNLTLANFILVLQVKGIKQKIKVIWKAKFDRQRLIDQIGFKIVFYILIFKNKI